MNATRTITIVLRTAVLAVLCATVAGPLMAQTGSADSTALAQAAERRSVVVKEAFAAANAEPVALVEGITFSKSDQWKSDDLIDGYAGDLKDLAKSDKRSVKGGRPDARILTKISAIALEQRAALRKFLSVSQRVRFDANLVKLLASSSGA